MYKSFFDQNCEATENQENVLDLAGGEGLWGQYICDITNASHSLCYDNSETMLNEAKQNRSVITVLDTIEGAINKEQNNRFSYILLKDCGFLFKMTVLEKLADKNLFKYLIQNIYYFQNKQ